MKRPISLVALCALLTLITSSALTAGSASKAETAQTLTGEIVDTGCYIGHGAHGADHQSCASRCIQGGMPMALLTADNALYLLTMSHENADPFNAAKGMAAATVEITGEVHTRGGMKSIEVMKIRKVDKSK